MSGGLKNCGECQWLYPARYLHPVYFGGAGGPETASDPVCGICALALTNKFHGTARDRFQGPHAEQVRRQALRWRETHPQRGS